VYLTRNLWSRVQCATATQTSCALTLKLYSLYITPSTAHSILTSLNSFIKLLSTRRIVQPSRQRHITKRTLLRLRQNIEIKMLYLHAFDHDGIVWNLHQYISVVKTSNAGDAAASPSKLFGSQKWFGQILVRFGRNFNKFGQIQAKFRKKWLKFGQIWLILEKIKILYPQMHSISYGYE